MTIASELRAIWRALSSKTRRGRAQDVLGARQPEDVTLDGFLDWYRAVVNNKVRGLSREEASRVMTPTGMSPLGIVKHLTWAEEGWFFDTFAGEWQGEEISNEASFTLEPDDTVESVLAAYASECDRSRRIVRQAGSLDKLSARAGETRGHVSLRWILVHMIEETARHAGHLDILCEQIDGRTGD
jgi:uncharacterized damage-inducible protein DinB